jgi:hypothetical protein
MNALSYVIIGLGAVALWHFIYEAVLLPSIRLNLRFKLFSLRDRLRNLKMECQENCPDDSFHLLDDSLSWQMDNLHKMTFSLLFDTIHLMKKEPALAQEMERREKIYTNCQIPEFIKIRNEQNVIAVHVVGSNSVGWLIYLLPIIFIGALWKRVSGWVKLMGDTPNTELDRISTCTA